MARGRLLTPAAAIAGALMASALLAMGVPGQARAWATVAPGEEIDRLPTREKVVALTFDDAWHDSSLEQILDILKEAGIKATFFPTGIGVESSPELARRIAEEGHDIGSHSYTHSKLEQMTAEELVAQIQQAEEAFSAAGLEDPAPLFRAPWGEANSRVLDVLAEQGYVHVLYGARGGDNVANRSAAEVVVRIMRDVRPGAIIVMHSNNDKTPQALPELIRRLQAKGYGFVTLRDALFSPEQSMSRYQQTSPWLTYVGEWVEELDSADAGGSVYGADSKGATLAAEFTGTAFELLAVTGPDLGRAWIVIDDGAAEEIDFYSETEQHRVVVFATSDLADGTHTVFVWWAGTKNRASTGHAVKVDAVQVLGGLVQAPEIIVPVFSGGWDLVDLLAPSSPLRAAD